MRWNQMVSRVLMGACLAALVTTALACEPPPKPKELVDFEALRQSKDTEELAKLAEVKEVMAHSEQFHVIAMEAYDDEDLERVKEYAVLGTMKYRTAKAVLDRNRATERMTQANEKYVRDQTVRNKNNEKREQIDKTITVLKDQIALKGQMAASKLESETEREKARQLATEKEKQLGAQEALAAAQVRRTEAEGIKADTFAPGSFNKANNALKAAERFMTNKDFDRAAQDAVEAQLLFAKAIEEALPSFKAEQDTVKRDDTNKKLFEQAHSTFRDLVKIDGRGMVITVDELFKTNKDAIDPNRMFLLDVVDKLAKDFPDYQLMIAGHTEKAGNATRNMTLSQSRAQVVRDFFLQRSIPAGRMQTAGYGNTQLAFENRGKERLRNNRVEIIFLYK